MDLISREAIDNLTKSDTKGSDYDRGWNDALYTADILPSAFEGMTYREVVRTLFPNAPVISNDLTGTVRVLFSDEVWDSPYKGVSE